MLPSLCLLSQGCYLSKDLREICPGGRISFFHSTFLSAALEQISMSVAVPDRSNQLDLISFTFLPVAL